MEISPWSPQWQDRAADLIVSIQRSEFEIPITRADQTDLTDIAGFYQCGNGGFWVASEGDEVVGTIALKDISQGQGALRKMFVRADRRGGRFGVAGALLERALDHARAQGVKTIFLGTTEKFKAAHRFYEKNGFAVVAAAALPSTFPRMAVDTRFYRLDVAA